MTNVRLCVMLFVVRVWCHQSEINPAAGDVELALETRTSESNLLGMSRTAKLTYRE